LKVRNSACNDPKERCNSLSAHSHMRVKRQAWNGQKRFANKTMPGAIGGSPKATRAVCPKKHACANTGVAQPEGAKPRLANQYCPAKAKKRDVPGSKPCG